jgi:membrane protease subunit HflK
MLTRDENIVDLRIAVQYQIKDPRDYLFEVIEPDLVLTQVVESTTREVIGKSTMDFVLTEGRSDIVARVEQLSQEILDLYQAGLVITNVNMQDAQPPEQVQDSFADAIKAREDEQRLKNEAEAYANEIIPKARGAGARRLEEANAYKAEVIAGAEGEAARFSALLDAYQRAPEVTRERLYLEAMERVLSINRKVLMDVPEGNNLLYLPLDSLGSTRRLPSPPVSQERTDSGSGSAPATVGAAAQRLRDLVRERDSRRREVR